MKIFVNEKHEIKALNFSEDTSLTEIEIDRELVFGDMSDFVILNYCYKQDRNGYSIYPSRSYKDIVEEEYRLKVDEARTKISVLENENLAMLESQKIQDRTIIENDMRMMDLEWALEDLMATIEPTAKINLTEVFNMLGRSATYFNQLKQMIEMENYDNKEDMERILNKYAAGSRPRINQEEYNQLFDLLYPPVYDIKDTTLEE